MILTYMGPQETLNYWKQLTHVLKYFRAEEDPKAQLPKNFISGFLEVRLHAIYTQSQTWHLPAYQTPRTPC